MDRMEPRIGEDRTTKNTKSTKNTRRGSRTTNEHEWTPMDVISCNNFMVFQMIIESDLLRLQGETRGDALRKTTQPCPHRVWVGTTSRRWRRREVARTRPGANARPTAIRPLPVGKSRHQPHPKEKQTMKANETPHEMSLQEEGNLPGVYWQETRTTVSAEGGGVRRRHSPAHQRNLRR